MSQFIAAASMSLDGFFADESHRGFEQLSDRVGPVRRPGAEEATFGFDRHRVDVRRARRGGLGPEMSGRGCRFPPRGPGGRAWPGDGT
jgi:hypothetical protein